MEVDIVSSKRSLQAPRTIDFFYFFFFFSPYLSGVPASYSTSLDIKS